MPTTWSLEQNIVWKTELPAWSGGTPIIWGDRIFITSPSKSAAAAPASSPQPSASRPRLGGNAFAQPGPQRRGPGGPGGPGGRRGGFGRGGRDPGGQTLFILCLSRKDGHELWRYELDEGNQLRNKGNATSPSPVTDGKHVWVVSGNGAVAALDMDGHEIWKRKLQDDYGQFDINWGYASSPLLYEGKLIVQVLQGNKRREPAYIVAFDAATGNPLWRVIRPTDAPSESPDAYTTPALLKAGGRVQIVISGGDYVTGHDPNTGAELWRTPGLNPNKARDYRIISSPVVVGDTIIAPTRKTPLLALKPSGPTEVPVIWQWTKNGGPDVPTPTSDGKYVYLVEDQGLVSCVDITSGEAVWGPRRSGAGPTSASPLLADGKLYILNENGETVVLAAGPEYKELAKNELDGSYTLSSPVAAGSQLFIRTGTHLYCIGNSAP